MQNYEHKFKRKSRGELTVEVLLFESPQEIIDNLPADYVVKTINKAIVKKAEKQKMDSFRAPRLSKVKRATIVVNVMPIDKLQEIYAKSEYDNASDAFADWIAQPEQAELLHKYKDADFLKG